MLFRSPQALKPFVSKLWYLLSDSELYGDLVTWDASVRLSQTSLEETQLTSLANQGTTVLVAHQHPRFVNDVLLRTFSHSSIAAFRRTLPSLLHTSLR